jgi:hypothetical protein
MNAERKGQVVDTGVETGHKSQISAYGASPAPR